MRILFVCSQNKLRSPTAEQVFSTWDGLEVTSAGLNNDAVEPLTSEAVQDADIIFVMEKTHRRKLLQKFSKDLKTAKVVCLDIPDIYAYMDTELIRLLEAKVPKFLRRGRSFG